MKRSKRNWFMSGVLITIPLLCMSCLERYEEITVAEDGTVTIVATFDGDRDNFAPPIALPSAPEWEIIEQKTDTTKEGDVEIELKARKVIPYKHDLPYSYASSDKPNYDINLQFPTEVEIIREGDRTIYEFKRTYVAREYAALNLSTSRSWDQELEDHIIENGIFNVSERDRDEYLDQFSAAFAYYQWRFIDMAAGELVGTEKMTLETYKKIVAHVWNYLQDEITPIRMLGILGKYKTAINDAFEELQKKVRRDILTIVASYEPYFDASRERLNKLKEKLKAEDFEEAEVKDDVRKIVRASVEQVIREAMPTDSIVFMTMFAAVYDQLSRRYDITERMGPHDFTVKLHMPGTIIITNGLKDPEDPGHIDWNFKGEDLRDRSITLHAISVVDK